MSEDPRWLDGNALGGLLQELFGAEMTAAPHTCQSCGTERPVAAHRVYLGAGVLSDVLCEVGVTDSALGAGEGHRDQAEDQVQGGWIVSARSAREFR
jgi:hypothetical protein